MTHKVWEIVQVAFLVTMAMMASQAFAQCNPRPELWTVLSIPPGRTAGIPVVCYDPATGVVSVDTRGVNHAIDTVQNTGEIQGDDVGPISLFFRGSPTSTLLLAPFQDGIAWTMNYFLLGPQIVGTPVAGWYLPVGVTEVLQYAPGLTGVHFGDVEMAINFAPMAPGGVVLGSVQLVPEPSSFAMLLAILCYSKHRRPTC